MYKVRRKSLREPMSPEDYWMGMAFWVAANSRSPSRQGAVIVSPANQLISQGFDSPPKSMPDADFFRHAEKAAIQDATNRVFAGATLYTTHTPCAECLMDIAAADIRRVVYFATRTPDQAANEVAHAGYMQLIEYKGSLGWMRDYISALQSAGVFA